jgi:hypothetical protein
MSLTELETVVDQLPLTEQEELLRHLEANLRAKRSKPSTLSREEWIKELDALRASLSTGKVNLTTEQILEELRED